MTTAAKKTETNLRIGSLFIAASAWVAMFVYWYFNRKDIFFGVPLSLARNPLEIVWNSILILISSAAVVRIFVIPAWKVIFKDTEKLGQKLEWYSSRYGQLSPDHRWTRRWRYLIILCLTAVTYLGIRIAGYPLLQSLATQDFQTKTVRAYFSSVPWVIGREFVLFSLALFLFLSLEGRSRLVMRFLLVINLRVSMLRFLSPLPPVPYSETSDELSICFFTAFADEHGTPQLNPPQTEDPKEVWVPLQERGLRGNSLVIAPVGGGKTAAFVRNILRQIINWQKDNPAKKAAAIVYDPKAELTELCKEIATEAGREADLVVLSFGSDQRMNPIKVQNCWAGETSWKVSGWIVGAWQNYQGKSSPEPYWESQNYILMRNLLVMEYVYRGKYVTLADAAEALKVSAEGCVRTWSGDKFITKMGERVLTVLAAFAPEQFTEQYSSYLFDKVKGREPSEEAKTRASEEKLQQIGQRALEREIFHTSTDSKVKDLFSKLTSPFNQGKQQILDDLEKKIEKRLEMLVSRDLAKEFGEEAAANEHDNLRAQLQIDAEQLKVKFEAEFGQDPEPVSIILESCTWLLDSWSSNAGDNRGSIVSNMLPFLQQFLTPDNRRTFSPAPADETTDFDRAIKEGQIVVPDFAGIKIGEKMANGIITLIKSRWQYSVLSMGDVKRHKVQVMDEAQKLLTIGDGGTNTGDLEYCELSRSFLGISWYLSQSVAALKAKASRSEEWDKVHGVLRSIYVLSTNDPASIKFMQDIAGKEAKRRLSKTVSESASTPRMEFLSEKYRGDAASLSISYTESEAMEEKIQASDIQDADANIGIATIYDGDKNHMMRIALRPEFWPSHRDSFKLMKMVKFKVDRRLKVKKSDTIVGNFFRPGVLRQFKERKIS
jgi:hypothetical protein